jgi:GTP cyclohydrolase IA
MAFDKHKTNPELGKLIEEKLRELGVNTPSNGNYFVDEDGTIRNIDSEDAYTQTLKISQYFENIMTVLGLDLNDDSMSDTPNRVAKMFVNELFWGLKSENFPKCTTVENKMGYDEMVVVKNIKLQSVCEHHWQNISGTATIAYIPKTKVLGLSKFSRITEYFSRRPQIQERLTEQIYHTLVYILETEDVAVFIDAKHSCMTERGVEDTHSATVTNRLGGRFRNDPASRVEFMHIATSKE